MYFIHSNLSVRPPPVSDTFPKYQHFLSQITVVGMSCRWPSLVSDCDHFLGWQYKIFYCFDLQFTSNHLTRDASPHRLEILYRVRLYNPINVPVTPSFCLSQAYWTVNLWLYMNLCFVLGYLPICVWMKENNVLKLATCKQE